ncbi:tetratricopeptide repeat protein [Pseudomonas sp. R5(2019)]|uniref:tetratricopeptide repeat protein n=1 Tax=Pseudomonas sp. R5(2019) TaxID=2697566 RepID=UPI001412F5D2|nr:tetratricopeptide repeat protein [Pseudomonas sp. R5(2019)]NBA97463.1 sel1 repeat family protein [Pseudomonas sp. R5(2019)]
MNRTGRALTLGCLLLLQPLLASAGGNSLLIPAMGRCTLNTQPEDLPQALAACQQAAKSGDSQAQYELGEFYYDGKNAPRDLNQALIFFEQASLQGHAQAQFRLGTMFFRGEGVPANNIQAYIVLKMAAVNGAEEALDTADEVSEQMRRDELETATQVLGQIFRKYLLELQTADGRTPFAPLP